jgi:hypothetical protein|tara:strand:- start:2836 stop:3636 length:801 start_codon:yes stop_codon:yes gene_type:complete
MTILNGANMVKHVTVWCLPRSGSTAYCNHLVNTGLVDQSVNMEMFDDNSLRPCFRQHDIDISLNHLPIDFSISKKLLTGEWIKENYNPDWVWIRYVEDGDKIFPSITDTPLTQYELDEYINMTMRRLRNTRSSQSLKIYADLPINYCDIDYDTDHHLLIRDPIDITLSREFAIRTKLWHSLTENDTREIDFILDFKDETLYNILKYTIQSQRQLEEKTNCFSTIVRYEDLNMTDNKFKKVWTLEQKLQYTVNLDEALERVNDELGY